VAFLPLAHLRVFTRREKARVRIERAQHAAHGARHERLGFDLVDVLAFDRAQRRAERFVVFGNLLFGRERAPAEQAADEGGHGDRDEQTGQRTIAAHVWHPNR
jgi:hypothetical protein